MGQFERWVNLSDWSIWKDGSIIDCMLLQCGALGRRKAGHVHASYSHPPSPIANDCKAADGRLVLAAQKCRWMHLPHAIMVSCKTPLSTGTISRLARGDPSRGCKRGIAAWGENMENRVAGRGNRSTEALQRNVMLSRRCASDPGHAQQNKPDGGGFRLALVLNQVDGTRQSHTSPSSVPVASVPPSRHITAAVTLGFGASGQRATPK